MVVALDVPFLVDQEPLHGVVGGQGGVMTYDLRSSVCDLLS